MTGSQTVEDLINGNSGEGDDLTRIRGIGPTKRQWLDLLGIRTIQDLASTSVDELESRLRAEGRSVSRSEIEGWIARSRELAGNLSSQQTADMSEAAGTEPPLEIGELSQSESIEAAVADYPDLLLEGDESSQSVEASAEVEPEGNLPPSIDEGEWRTFASFIVEFQTRQVEGRTEQQTTVRQRETGIVKTWSGIERDYLQRWMQKQTSERMQPKPEAEKPTAKTPVIVEIAQLQVCQPPRTGLPITVNTTGQGFPSSIRSGESFALEVAFRLAGLKAADIAQQKITYFAQVYARQRSTDINIHLGDTKAYNLAPNRPFYTALLSEATLQQPGTYRLQALVTFQGVSLPPAFFEVPLLQVI